MQRSLHVPFLVILIFLFYQCTTQQQIPIAPIQWPEAIPLVKIDSSAYAANTCEPTICINPMNPNQILAGSILDQLYISNDGGLNWEESKLESPYGVYGDPVIRADYKGNFYYAHLSNPDGRAYSSDSFLDRIVIQKSTDGGRTWNEGTYPKIHPGKDQDKHWLAMDPKTNHIVITWTEFDKYGSKEAVDKSRILFSKSTDLGITWSDPISINQFEGDCIDSDQTTEGAVPSFGPNGEIYVCWAYDENIYFDLSTDGGTTWKNKDIVVAKQPGGWNIDIPGISRVNGMPISAVDLSPGPHNGDIYINWSDQRNGSDDTDIWIAKSSDQGMTWSDPIRVNDDPAGHHQFFSWMDIDETTGYIYIIFYDRRFQTERDTDVFIAYSTDGGKTFINKKINQKPFTPTNRLFFGDYNDISAVNNQIRPIWTEMNGTELSVWTAIINLINN